MRKQGVILLADKTIFGRVIAKVVGKRLTAAQPDCRGWRVVVTGDHHHVVGGSDLRQYFVF